MNLLATLVPLILIVSLSHANQPKTQALTFTTAKSDYSNYVSEAILKEAYGKIGIEIQVLRYPDLKGLKKSNAGSWDGELQRMKGLTQKYSRLIRVPVMINNVELVVYARDPNIVIKKPADLAPYHVGYYKGALIFDKLTQGFARTSGFSTQKETLKMLAAGKVDVVIGDTLTAPWRIKHHKIKGLHPLSPPLMNLQLYHFLNKRHKALIPKITKVLKSMKKRGRLETIRKRIISRYQVK